MEFFHSWQDFFTFDRKEIARFFQDATAFMDGFHGSFAATKGAEERCRDLCTMAGNVFHGRGGGSPTSSQGGGIAGSDWKAQAKALEKAMLEALNSK